MTAPPPRLDIIDRSPAISRRSLLAAAGALATTLLTPDVAHAATPPIWVGSPIAGTWGLAGWPSTTPAGGHHRLVKANPRNDWSVDLTNVRSNTVKLYVAPSDSRYGNRVTTRVTQLIKNDACSAGGGGDLLTIAIRFDGATVGQLTIAHLTVASSLRVGSSIGRWGTTLGSLSQLSGAATGGDSCWSGKHGHVELRASSKYSCWNKGYRLGQQINHSNFIGFVSGPALASSARA